MLRVSKKKCTFALGFDKQTNIRQKTMKKIRAAVVGYGNIGKYTIQALEAAPDFEIAGVVRRNGAADKPIELTPYEVVKDIKELKDVDVAILATPTRSCEDYAKQIVPLGINTVDSFDIHTQIRGYRERQMELNKQTNTVSVIAAGWDPGSDSIVRTLMQGLAPKGLSYTNFGPGMSMGHSVCARSKAGVKNALSMTIPLGEGIHRRMVYVELEDGFTLEQVAKDIKAAEDPAARRQEKIKEYQDTMMNPYIAASRGYVDDVIMPHESRKYLISAFESLKGKRVDKPLKKHGNIPL